MSASYTGLLAGMLLALAIIVGQAMGVLLVLLLGGLGFIAGGLLSGESRSFRRSRFHRR
ncbi:DUF2273 domain-containing protein [Glycomyces sp. NPDC021274]|uniref:DUF2273 domain-containing protein n=1 Tax=Glycomyces sp. NPDC021274 TaxID=3155120 RepID=UPI0033DD711B